MPLHTYFEKEHDRILNFYNIRAATQTVTNSLFSFENLAHIYRIHERYRATMLLLKTFSPNSLSHLNILDVGCGDGNMLRQLAEWGAAPALLHGIELRPEAVQKSTILNPPGINIVLGSAVNIPYPDESFDIVFLNTVMSSIKLLEMRIKIAAEITRVLRSSGCIVWYDFIFNNPANKDVQGIRKKDIQTMFPIFALHTHKITLAPFIARRIPNRLIDILYPLLSLLPFMKTHIIGLLCKPAASRYT